MAATGWWRSVSGSRRGWLRCAGVLAALSVLATPIGAATGPESRAPSLGLLLDPGADVAGLPDASDLPVPPFVRLVGEWAEIERAPGVYDWSDLGDTVATLTGAGYRVALCLTGSNPLYLADGAPPSAIDEAALTAWSGFARSAVRAFGGAVHVYEIWDRPSAPGPGGAPQQEPEAYAFLLKRTALALRAEARVENVEPRVAQGAVGGADLPWQRGLWDRDVSAYVDILPVMVTVDWPADELPAMLASLDAEVLAHPPAPEVWVYLEASPGASGHAPLAAGVRALAAGARRALVRLSPDPEERAAGAAWVTGFGRAMGEEFAPAPGTGVALLRPDGSPLEAGGVLGRFRSSRDLSSLVVYHAMDPSALEEARLVVPGGKVRGIRSLDPAEGREKRTTPAPIPGGRRGLRAPLRPYPMALLFGSTVATPGFELPPEELDVESTRGLTAAEIIARYQQVQRVQDDALERWTARGRVDFHFKLAQGGATIDISIDSNYFWERGGALEWEQTDYYVNGNRIRWKKIPELPLVQPEKVITLPLDLTLDKTYAYRLVGEDRVDGRDTWVLAFEPTDPDAAGSLYRGRVWVDRTTFRRLKVSLVQSGLDAPVLSNEERDRFRPHPGPDGGEYWMLAEADGQQVWSAGGRNFIVRRELRFTDFEINPPRDEFEARRRTAYASDNQMLRDTDDGFRYLVRKGDGTRQVKESVDTSQWFAAAGAFQDSSSDGVIPLAGVNYFDYDLAGKGIQANLLFGGVLAFFTATKPDLFGGRVSATAEAAGVAIRFNDKRFVGAVESRLERLQARPQNLSLRVGIPLGSFFKVSLVGGATRREYTLEKDTRRALSTFNDTHGTAFSYRLPPNHLETRGTVELEFNRFGYTLLAAASRATRSSWEPFGLFDANSGSQVEFLGGAPGDAASYIPQPTRSPRRGFTQWGASLFKEFYLPKFQKLRGELNYLGGSELDRFSRYEFSFFGDTRLNGYAGSGVRFDRGIVGRAGYSFNLFEVIRFDAALESARVRREGDPGDLAFSGAGLSANFVGPFKTVISLNYGVALRSDIPALEGESEFLLLVLKLF